MIAFIFKSLGDAKEEIRARASTCYVLMYVPLYNYYVYAYTIG